MQNIIASSLRARAGSLFSVTLSASQKHLSWRVVPLLQRATEWQQRRLTWVFCRWPCLALSFERNRRKTANLLRNWALQFLLEPAGDTALQLVTETNTQHGALTWISAALQNPASELLFNYEWGKLGDIISFSWIYILSLPFFSCCSVGLPFPFQHFSAPFRSRFWLAHCVISCIIEARVGRGGGGKSHGRRRMKSHKNVLLCVRDTERGRWRESWKGARISRH